jgi:alanine or glycine:cation symporter, AGCS family
MIEQLLAVAARIDALLWGPWTMAFIAATALFFTLRSRFFQVRKFGFILRRTAGTVLGKRADARAGRLTPFQAVSTALASTVGMGNMAGVATALSLGGPGAVFWMWVLAFLGMMTKTAEITLAVHYRDAGAAAGDAGAPADPGGTGGPGATGPAAGPVRGGPMHYIRKGLGWGFLAKAFSVGVIVNALFTATLLQSHTVGRAFLGSYGLNPYVTTAVIAAVTGAVILGGLRRIGRFCARLVPAMSLVYIAAGLVIFLLNIDKAPAVFAMIVGHAFSPVPAAAGVAGHSVAAALKYGMARGMLSNEAGLGTAPMVHATADTPHPFQQGMWGAFEVFVDTVVICTISAFAVLATGVLDGGRTGIELVLAAFRASLPAGAASAVVSFSILTFCLSTQIGFFIYFETAASHVFGGAAVRWLRWVYLVPGVLFAGFADVDRLWVFANIAVGACALPNLVAVLALSGVFFALMRDFLEGRNAYATDITDRTREYIRTARRRAP